MEFYVFDGSYVERLRAGDFRTQEHFVAYFSELIKVKVRSRVRRPEDIEDIRQETFTRVLRVLRTEQGLHQPEKLGAFVNSTCNNVLFEYYRSPKPESSEDEEQIRALPDRGPGALDRLVSSEVQAQVQQILDDLPERDRRLIRAVLLQEQDKDEICEELGVSRDYLRVLLHRAVKSFKKGYLQQANRQTQQPASMVQRR